VSHVDHEIEDSKQFFSNSPPINTKFINFNLYFMQNFSQHSTMYHQDAINNL
jgi:hypothetical protein